LEVLALLKDKARRVYTIASSQTVEDAICLMAGRKVRALLVTENDQPAGIFSEEDLFRSLLEKKTAAFSEIKLETAMTRKLLLAKPQDPITTVLDKMVAADINYLPVIEEKKIIGILTLKDMLKHQIDALIDEIHQLKDYIADLHEAGQD
jgi:CBS domain-containing protein